MGPSARALVFGAILLAAACAPGGRRGGPPMDAPAPSQIVAPDALIFLEYDADRDRRITRAELARGAEASWQEASKGAGDIGYIEWRDWLVKVIGSDGFDVGPVSFDTNTDLRITKAEFIDALNRRFTALDANSDGAISRDEAVKRSLTRTGPQGIGPPGGGGERPSGEGGPGGGGGPPGGGRQ